MIYLIYLTFVYFSTKGILIYCNFLPDILDIAFNFILKLAFIGWAFNLFIKKNGKIFNAKILIILFTIFLASSLVNMSSPVKILRFLINVFYTISIFYHVLYVLKSNYLPNFFIYAWVYVLIQIVFCAFFNMKELSKQLKY
jgi:hypothetical protein